MRLSLMKAAHAAVGGAPWQEIRIRGTKTNCFHCFLLVQPLRIGVSLIGDNLFRMVPFEPTNSSSSHQRVQIAVIAPKINNPPGDHWGRKDRAYALYFCYPGEHVVIEIGNIDCFIVRTSIGFAEA
jgi:hypothetical protein